jgi:predicted metalloprotease with PDZ domain
MNYMYHEYYKTKKRGYTDEEFQQGLEKFAGKNLDEFYKKYVYGLADIDYNKYLGYAGYTVADENAGKNEPSIGITSTNGNNKIVVKTIVRDGAAWVDGISAGDEIVAIDGHTVNDSTAMFKDKKPGDKISVTLHRDGLTLTLPVTLLRNPTVKYKITPVANPSAQQTLVRNKWLKL